MSELLHNIGNASFVGCVLRCMKFERMRTATRLAPLSSANCESHFGARSTPYTFVANLQENVSPQMTQITQKQKSFNLINPLLRMTSYRNLWTINLEVGNA
jgi:hypothetical protein